MTSKMALLAGVGILFSAPASAQFVTYQAHGPVHQIIDFSFTGFTQKMGLPDGPTFLMRTSI